LLENVLEAAPIQFVHDRLVSKYAEPRAAAPSELRRRLEERVEKVFEIYIKTTPERFWERYHRPREEEQVLLRPAGQIRLDARLAL
jgi:hypothetical protein